MAKQRISYVDPATITDAAMLEELERCRREGTPRPESQAIRAHVMITAAPKLSPALEAALRRIPEVRTLHSVSGTFDMVAIVAAETVDAMDRLIDRIGALDVDQVVPGHGPVTTLKYLAVQRANLLDWKAAVADAVAQGWTRDETIARVNFADRYPVDIGQGYMMDHIQTLNAASLWDKFTGAVPPPASSDPAP